MNNLPIAVFDSGIGGLSIYREIQNLLPKESLIYFADQAYCPYGTKSPHQIQKRVIKILKQLMTKQIKLAVIACNTATTVGVDYYRNSFPMLPIIGVVPVIKTASQVTNNKKVLIWATEATIKNNYVETLITNHGEGVTFYKQGDPNGFFVKHIERGVLETKELKTKLQKMLDKYVSEGVDTIVLGCTHFPFISHLITSIYPHLQILDSGGAVARHVVRRLEEKDNLAQNTKPNYTFYTTGRADLLEMNIQKFIGLESPHVMQLDIK